MLSVTFKAPINILTLRNPYVQSVTLLSPRTGNSHLETTNIETFQVIDSAHIQANHLFFVEQTARVFFSKPANINLASPTSTFSHFHSHNVHAICGLSDFTTRGPFLESANSVSGPKSCFMFAVFAFKTRVSIILKIIFKKYQY